MIDENIIDRVIDRVNNMTSEEALQKVKQDYITEMLATFVSFTVLNEFKRIVDNK